MSKNMNLHGRMRMLGGLVLANEDGSLPANPELNTFWSDGGQSLVYTTIDGITGWFPVVQGQQQAVHNHVQAVAKTTWKVEHNLGTKDIFFMVKDATGTPVGSFLEYRYDADQPNNIVYFDFASAESGSVYMVALKAFSSPVLKTSEIQIGADFVIDSSGFEYQGERLNMSALVNVDQAVQSAQNTANNASTVASQASTAAVLAGGKADQAVTKATAAETTASAAVTAAQAAQVEAASKITEAEVLANFAPYDIPGGTPEAITANMVLVDFPAVRKFRIPANFAGSYWTGDTNAAASTSFDVTVNGTVIGTFTVAAGTVNGTPSGMGNAVTVQPGQRVKVVARTADTALKGVAFCIKADLVK